MAIGFLTRAYASFGLSEHGLYLESFIVETFNTPVVWISLAAFFIGIGLFYVRKRYAQNTFGAQTITVAQEGYGFDMFYGWIIRGLKGVAVQFRKTHTGDLNYNIAGIVIGFLVLLLLIFFLGGGM
jgi:hypothetical protein